MSVYMGELLDGLQCFLCTTYRIGAIYVLHVRIMEILSQMVHQNYATTTEAQENHTHLASATEHISDEVLFELPVPTET